MPAPVPLPPQCQPLLDHSTAEIEPVRLDAPGGCPGATSRANRSAFHWFAADQDMTLRAATDRAAQEQNEAIPSLYSGGSRAGMAEAAASVHLPRRDAGEADPRPFRTPDRPVSVPDMRRGAGKGQAGGDYL